MLAVVKRNNILMKKILLITFGCSWTYGKGLGYEEGMSRNNFELIHNDHDLAETYSFRKLLCNKYNAININFSASQSSNQKQFRLAKEFFISKKFRSLKKIFDEVIILWCITSTTRNEIYSVIDSELRNFKYDWDHPIAKFLSMNCYNHENEIAQLTTEMIFFNDFFSASNIKNLWVDTFNHHDYTIKIDNLVNVELKNRDLLSQMTLENDNFVKKEYYEANYNYTGNDSRIKVGVQQKLLNPYSLHPTKTGHEKIAQILSPHIENLL